MSIFHGHATSIRPGTWEKTRTHFPRQGMSLRVGETARLIKK